MGPPPPAQLPPNNPWGVPNGNTSPPPQDASFGGGGMGVTPSLSTNPGTYTPLLDPTIVRPDPVHPGHPASIRADNVSPPMASPSPAHMASFSSQPMPTASMSAVPTNPTSSLRYASYNSTIRHRTSTPSTTLTAAPSD